MTLQQFLDHAWQGYVNLTPDAQRIRQILTGRGESVVNDHIAIRTFRYPGISRGAIAGLFETWGYCHGGDLDFPEKHLKASYYLPPDRVFPKVFVSELVSDTLSSELQDWVGALARQAARQKPAPEMLLTPAWEPVRLEDYERFYGESEYAAWTAAFGIRVNHFTVLVNELGALGSLEQLNDCLKANGIALSEAGGVIKGSPESLLEQSSTKARKIPWSFAGGVEAFIPGCYYEFARRYPLPGTNGLFEGFIADNAAHIFDSTHR